ncbi:MAG: hypothetical protein ACKVQW_09930 [Pyrinomonadaceae bacterium]
MAKTITVVVLGADRELWRGSGLTFEVRDMRKGLKVLSKKTLAAGVNTVRANLELEFNAGQVYGISIDAPGHRSAWQLINRRTFISESGGSKIEVSDHMIQLMLVPEKTTSSDLNDGFGKLRDRGSPFTAPRTGLTEQKFADLLPAAKMAFLNLEAKLRGTHVGGNSLLSFVEGVRLVRVDRVFVFAGAQLKSLIDDSADFASAPGHNAPKGDGAGLPAHKDSWKHTRFGAGNVQLSFSRIAEPLPNDGSKMVFSADIDIDLEKGLLHVFEWLDNKLLNPKKKTDQTQVYALLFSQEIFPEYTLDRLVVP